MKTSVKFYLMLTIFCFLTFFNSFSQEKAENLKMIVENKEKAFVDEGEYVRISFKVHGLYSGQSTKPYVEQASLVSEIKKLNISNIVDQNGLRTGYVLVNKAEYLKALSTTLNILKVKEIEVDNKITDIAGYIEMCK